MLVLQHYHDFFFATYVMCEIRTRGFLHLLDYQILPNVSEQHIDDFMQNDLQSWF